MVDANEAPVTLTQDQRDALRKRYRDERDKRIRPDGINQYVEPTGKFAVLEEDPYAPWVARAPLTDHVEFLFVGGGFAGLSVCARLKEAGIDDFRIIEGGGDFGGVWYWNRYPGAMCDTAAMVYLPLLEETGFEFNTDYTHRSGFEVVGRGGVTLTDKWAKGMQSFQGMHVHGFPNMFIVGIFQGSSLASNVTSNYVDIGHTVAAVLTHAKSIGAGQVETLPEAEADWIAAIEKAPKGIVGGPDCTPGYYNSEGQDEGRKPKLDRGGYPLGPVPFFDYIADWRTNGTFKGLAFR